MNIAIFCTVIALIAGVVGATPRKASFMGAVVAFVSGFTAFSVENGFPDWFGLYRVSVFALLFALPAAIMSFTVAKLKRNA
ncbi:hypothetical protein ACNPNN_11330 [Stenotrophomonas geniculata]|uniref:hypothetical protein n=1 Tax=Stenotrophomonas geniculata TaxID=86188 RepID=UPI001CD021A8